MEETFALHTKPFSVNSLYYKGGYIKTQEWREWSSGIFNQLSSSENQSKLARLRDAFKASENHVHVDILVIYPTSKFYTQKNEVSAQTQDVTNFEKTIVDLLFDNQYHTSAFPYGCPNLNINDKYVTRCLSEKIGLGEENFMVITIRLVPAVSRTLGLLDHILPK